MTGCGPYDPLLETYADGEIEGEDLSALRLHLDGCGSCRRELRERTRLKVRIGGDAFPPAPPDLRIKIGRMLSPPRRLPVPWIALALGLAALVTGYVMLRPPTSPPTPSPTLSPTPSPTPSQVLVAKTAIGLLSILHQDVLDGTYKWPLVEYKGPADVVGFLQMQFGETPKLPEPAEAGWMVVHASHRGICADCARAAGSDIRQTYEQALNALFPDLPNKVWIMCRTEGPLVSCVVAERLFPIPSADLRTFGNGHLGRVYQHGRNTIVVQQTAKLTVFWIARADETEMLETLFGTK